MPPEIIYLAALVACCVVLAVCIRWVEVRRQTKLLKNLRDAERAREHFQGED